MSGPAADEPRPRPLPPGEWPEAMGEALAALHPKEPRHPFPPRDPGRPKGLNLLGTLAHHPPLATAFHTLAGHLLFATTLSLRQRELLILRVASVRRSEYEWLQHVVLADDVGLTALDLERVAAGPDAEGWSAADAALLRAVDELIADARISDATWAVVARDLSPQQLLDVVFTVGSYDVLAMALRTFDVEPDADLREWKPGSL